MTPTELKAALTAAAATNQPLAAAIAAGDTDTAAKLFSVGRTRLQTTPGGIGTVLETLGPVDGAALLDALDAAKATIPALKWAWVLIDRGDLDFGSAATQAQLDALAAAGVITTAAANALKAIAVVPDPVSQYAVAEALNRG